jgi:ribonuclease HII
MQQNPDFEIEKNCGCKIIAGLDEAGRGPLCGPVVAAAVIFPNFDIEIPVVIRDSKKMSPHQRAIAYDWIVKNTVWGIGQCSPAEIDELNILWASMRAMERAVGALKAQPEMCLIDGNRVPKNLMGRAVVRGDAKSISIAAASILAKTYRDEWMVHAAAEYPLYNWEKNKGYPTKDHRLAIIEHGVCPLHRLSYEPCQPRLSL